MTNEGPDSKSNFTAPSNISAPGGKQASSVSSGATSENEQQKSIFQFPAINVLEGGGSRYAELEDNFPVYRYRSRIEGLFTRVEKWGGNTGETHWRSVTKEHITTLYGQKNNEISTINHTLQWQK